MKSIGFNAISVFAKAIACIPLIAPSFAFSDDGLLQSLQNHLPGQDSFKPPYPIIDSGYIERDSDRINWLDNDRIIFKGSDPQEYADAVRQHLMHRPTSIYIWDTRNNTVSKYAPIDEYGGLCYFRGYIYFDSSIQMGKSRSYKEGIFGSETETTTPWNTDVKHVINTNSCRPVDPKYISGTKTELLEEHGIIDADPTSQKPIKLYKPGELTPIELPINGIEEYSGFPRYFEWNNTYIFYGWYGTLSRGMTYPVYLLTPDGHVTTYHVYDQNGWFLSSEFAPTKKGLMIFSPRTKGGLFSSINVGIYLFKGNELQQVIDEPVHNYGVSPDGCKVAVAMRLRHSARSFPSYISDPELKDKREIATASHLQVINLCAK